MAHPEQVTENGTFRAVRADRDTLARFPLNFGLYHGPLGEPAPETGTHVYEMAIARRHEAAV